MISAHRHGAVVHLHAEGNDDADRRDMAAILAAYFEAEQAPAVRRVLSKRLGGVALIALMFEAMTRLMSATVFAGLFAFVCGTGLVGGMVNVRTGNLCASLTSMRSTRNPDTPLRHTRRIDTDQSPALVSHRLIPAPFAGSGGPTRRPCLRGANRHTP